MYRPKFIFKPDLAFEYGPAGNRVIKIVKPKDDNEPWKYTYYVCDASGNVMAVYSRLSDKKIQYDQITFSTSQAGFIL